MILYTIGFTQKSAEQFFTLIRENKIELLLDIRLNNKSQLAGFAKENDLKYFLDKICNCSYEHCLEFAPTEEILEAYRKKIIDWNEYENLYTELMNKRQAHFKFTERFSKYQKIMLLCSEPTAKQCHRRLLSELIQNIAPDIIVKHL
jgi:uncharacterized protein (DUF488 family)